MVSTNYFQIKVLSSGLDDWEESESLELAIKKAKKRLKEAETFSGNAAIYDGAKLLASLSWKNGRLITRKWLIK